MLALSFAVFAALGCGAGPEARGEEDASSSLDDVGDTLHVAGGGWEWRPLRWLSSDRVLFFVERTDRIAVATPEGELLLEAELTDPHLAISPDGSEVAYAAWELAGDPFSPDRASALYVAPLRFDSPPERLLRVEGEEMRLAGWTVDGHYLVVAGLGDQTGTVQQAIPREGGEARGYLAEHLVKGSATVVIPPGGPLPAYGASPPLWTVEGIAWDRLAAGTFGPWVVSRDGRRLDREHLRPYVTDTCGSLLRSPDGAYVACEHVVSDKWAGGSARWGAIVRLRN